MEALIELITRSKSVALEKKLRGGRKDSLLRQQQLALTAGALCHWRRRRRSERAVSVRGPRLYLAFSFPLMNSLLFS